MSYTGDLSIPSFGDGSTFGAPDLSSSINLTGNTNTLLSDGIDLNNLGAFPISAPVMNSGTLDTSLPSIDAVSTNSGTSTGNASGTSTDTSASEGGVNWSNVIGAAAQAGSLGLRTFGQINAINNRAQFATTAAQQQLAFQAAQSAALEQQQLAANASNPLLALTRGSSIMPWLIIGAIFLFMSKK